MISRYIIWQRRHRLSLLLNLAFIWLHHRKIKNWYWSTFTGILKVNTCCAQYSASPLTIVKHNEYIIKMHTNTYTHSHNTGHTQQQDTHILALPMHTHTHTMHHHHTVTATNDTHTVITALSHSTFELAGHTLDTKAIIKQNQNQLLIPASLYQCLTTITTFQISTSAQQQWIYIDIWEGGDIYSRMDEMRMRLWGVSMQEQIDWLPSAHSTHLFNTYYHDWDIWA